MDLGSLLVILAILVLVGLFVSRPFFESSALSGEVTSSKEEHDISTLMAERDRILNALQELDFDSALGKIPQEDYPIQRETLLQHGAEVLRQLDEYQAKNRADPRIETATGYVNDDAIRRVESVVEQRQLAGAASNLPNPSMSQGSNNGQPLADNVVTIPETDDDIETLIANRRRERQGKSSGFCAKCGGTLQEKDHFCPKCGASIL